MFRKQLVFFTVAIGFVMSLSGCGDFFAEKSTELESMNIIRELSRVEATEGVKNPVPDAYLQPAKIIVGGTQDIPDAKLLYFTKNQKVATLATMVQQQYTQHLKNDKGVPYVAGAYTVSQNPATNQLIVKCPTSEEAQQVLDFLKEVDVPPIQVEIDCLISEVYADHTMDWETTLLIENIFGVGLNLGGKINDVGEVLPAFPGAALRDIARSSFGLKAGFTDINAKPGHQLNALVDLLVSRGYLKILMNPTLKTVNGQTATIITSEHVPLDVITYVHPVSGVMTQSTEYKDIVDSLSVTPTVYADGTIGLSTAAQIASKSTPDGVKQVPIVTDRKITMAENRVTPGESLVVGGITKTEKRSVVRGVPFLKDIPLIGILFSSKDFEERGKEVIFILTPSIAQNGIPNEKMVEDIRDKHRMIRANSLSDAIMDPFGGETYINEIEEEAADAEIRTMKAEMELEHVTRIAESRAKELNLVVEKARAQKKIADKAMAELRTINDAKLAADKVATDALAAKAAADKAVAKATADAAAAKVAANKATAETTAAKAQAAESQKRAAEAEAARKAAEEKLKQQQSQPGPEPRPTPGP